MLDFLKELTRRKVWLFGGIYLALGWIVLQVVIAVEATMELPNWIDQSVLVLLVVGFPFALLLAWAQESQKESQGRVSAGTLDPHVTRRDLSVAVLPFDDLSRDGDFVEVADGVPEDILTQLAAFSALDVAARNSSFAFKGTSPDIRQVGEALGVRFVLEGSFRRSGDHVRLTAQLIETVTGGHVWADSFDLPAQTWASDLDGTVEGMVAGVFSTIYSVESKRLLAGPLEALTVVQLTSFATMHIADVTLEKLKQAQTWIELALNKSPEDGYANAAMGRIKAMLPSVGGGDKDVLWADAIKHLEKSKKAGPPDLDILVALAGASFAMGRQNDLEVYAEQMRDRAPKYPGTWGFTCIAGLGAGRWDEVLAASSSGLRLSSPRSPYYINFLQSEAIANAGLGNFEAAEKAARKFLVAREGPAIRGVLVTALVNQERLEEAKSELATLRAAIPGLTLATAAQGLQLFLFPAEMKNLILEGVATAGLE